MLNTSALYNAIIAGEHWFETAITYKDANNVTRTLYGANIFELNAGYSMFAESHPGAGACLAAELSLTVANPEYAIPRMGKLNVWIRACGTIEAGTESSVVGTTLFLQGHTSVSSGTLTFDENSHAAVSDTVLSLTNQTGEQQSEWLPQGKFYVDTRELTKNDDGRDLLTIHAYDSMLKTEADYPDTTHAWPTTDASVINEIASAIGVSVDTRTWAAINKSYSVSAPLGYSMREVLENIGAMYAGNWIITYEGKLLFVGLTTIPEETNYLIDTAGFTITFGGDRILV